MSDLLGNLERRGFAAEGGRGAAGRASRRAEVIQRTYVKTP